MIRVDRSLIPAPATLSGTAAQERRRAAQRFFANRPTRRPQRRFDFGLQFAHPDLRNALLELFAGKCAYCERPIEFTARTGYLDRHRPTHGAIDAHGRIAVDHYWWLAYEWENMVGACAACNRAKGSRFPIEGKRASMGTKGAALQAEKPHLLDPCEDLPDEHLLFSADGRVSALSARGRVTIEVLALNRASLVEERARAALLFARELEHVGSQSAASLTLTADGQPFAALRRELMRQHQNRESSKLKEAAARKGQRRHDQDSRRFAGAVSGIKEELARARYIEQIELRNIGIHRSLDLRVQSEQSSNAPWLMLLGENGVGKSTLLKAIGFALAGKSEWPILAPMASTILPAHGGVGSLRIRFSDGDFIEMSLDASRRELRHSFHDPRIRILGFGATRLLPTEKHPPPLESGTARLRNLFDPFCPLGDAIHWLGGLAPVPFDNASATLKALLNLPDDAVFRKSTGTVVLERLKHQQDLSTLSDGYQTVIGVACGIMSVLLAPGLPIDLAEGIVLIDEMGNHLHPTWRMRIVQSFKRAFPKVQFLATTHEPLCLRGLENDEIAVLRRTGPRSISLIDKLPPIRGLRVDQILSSSLFGLDSTVDPMFASQLREYYDLLARKALSDEQRQRLAALEPEIARFRQIGDSPSEQILYRTIDEHVAQAEKELRPIDPAALPDDLRATFRAVLKSATTKTSLPQTK